MSNELDAPINNIVPIPTGLVAKHALRSPVLGQLDGMGPIEQTMRAKIAKLKNCKYPDTFDWSVYDQISSKFEEPPRGGVVFGTTFKLANWHSTCSKCHYTFEIDTYGRGCFHDCGYCYAKDQLTSRGYWNQPQPFPVDLAEIRKVFYTVFETDKASRWRSIMEKRIPLRIGSMSDSFMWMDVKYRVTEELLRILSFYRYPNLIFTRSDLVAHDNYLNLLDPQISSVQFSMLGNRNELIRKIEPGAPNYQRRLVALKKLHEAGIWTGVRINPLFPQYPDGYYTDPASIAERFPDKASIPSLDLYNDDLMSELAEAKVSSVLVGFVRLGPRAVTVLSKRIGIPLRSFFKPEIWSAQPDKCFSPKEIAFYYKKMHKSAMTAGLRFSTCYIGNGIGEYFKHQDLWTNKTDCCDVVGNVSAFASSSQDIPWKERKQHSAYKQLAEEAELADIAATANNGLEAGTHASSTEH